MTAIGSLFSGYGGLEMGVQQVLDADTAWHIEHDPAPSRILAHHWPDIPNHGDITTVDWATVEPVEILCGGFPCQDVSTAGLRRGLKPGTRSGLWSHFALAIDVLRPSLVIVENVRGLLSAEAHSALESDPWSVGDGSPRPALRALGAVLGDLADLGYDARWHGIRAADAGAPHGRFRVFCLAYPAGDEGRLGDRNRLPAEDTNGAARGERGFAAPGQTAGRPAWADARGRDRAPASDTTHDHRGRSAGTRATDRRAWGEYGPAIARWEAVLDREAPAATEHGRLSPRFVEWMMGLPAGHVTDVGLTRSEQLKALGNGVVPQQAALALSTLVLS